MELQIAPCSFKNMPADIMDLIASFLTFDDIESEEEFIQRKKNSSGWIECSQNKRLNEKETQFSFLKNHINIEKEGDIFLFIYNSHDTICATKYLTTPVNAIQDHNLSIINMKKNKELHNICLQQDFWNISKKRHYEQGKRYGHLTISSSGNILAIIYTKKVDNDNFGWKSFIKIQNLRTQTKEHPAYPNDMGCHEIIAFNKQDTHLIVHGSTWDPCANTRIPQHTIIPLTTTLDNPPKKTFIHYCAQKMICKNLML